MKMNKSLNNTKQKGALRFFIYFDKKDKEFVGVCIDIGLIKCGENPYFVEKDLTDASFGYVENVCKNNLPDYLLNELPPQEYLDKFEQYQKLLANKKIMKNILELFEDARSFIKPIPCYA